MGVGKLVQLVRQASGRQIATLDPVTGEIPVDQLPVMIGATPILDGEKGVVPAPQDMEDDEFLRGDATWVVP